MAEDPSPRDRELLHDLASSPRPNGSAALSAARARCIRELRDMGFTVREEPFDYSAFPGRLGTPLVGASALAMVVAAGHWGARGARYFPLAVLIIGIAVLIVIGGWLARKGTTQARWMRARGVNLVATPPGSAPALWLCAHLDTKSQPIPTLGRMAGIALEGMGVLATVALALAAASGLVTSFAWWTYAALLTLAGAVLVVSSVVGTRSPGALDNASGVVAVLAAARRPGVGQQVGVLITEAEELGLAGARAWAKQASAAVVLNCDGVDDEGGIAVMFSGRRPDSVIDAVHRASQATRVSFGSRRLPLGVLTDSVAFTDAGLASVTFSRGTLGSLARVHSARDDLSRLRGSGIAATATLMAGTARELNRAQASPLR